MTQNGSNHWDRLTSQPQSSFWAECCVPQSAWIRYWVVAFSVGLVGWFVQPGVAQNLLWQQRDPVMVNPYADVKARRPGDLLVVRINERSNVQNRDLRLMQKRNRSSSAANLGTAFSGDLGGVNGGLGFEQGSSGLRSFNGDAEFRSERGFVDQFTVAVTDITPNGNLLVTGTRNVMLEGDQRTLVLTGVVRAADILPDNTIPSSRVSNLDIRYLANAEIGAEDKFINQGWLGRKLNRWWPH